MKLNELIITLCKKQCVATEAGTGFIYAASILLWTSIDCPKDNSLKKTRPAQEQHVQGCTGTAKTLQFTQPL